MQIIEKIPQEELLAGLAEEAAELAQAALKLRRVIDGTNPTPKTHEEALDSLEEEIADVHLYLNYIDYDSRKVTEFYKNKRERWENRLKAK